MLELGFMEVSAEISKKGLIGQANYSRVGVLLCLPREGDVEVVKVKLKLE